MDLTVVSPIVTWAVPVKPTELGWHLESYLKILPTLTTLRLCHRFGTGPNVHITKLPPEILDAVETVLFTSKHRSTCDNDWAESFEHFEGRCAPIDHFLDSARLNAIEDNLHFKCEGFKDEAEASGDDDWTGCDDCYQKAMEAASDDLYENGFCCGDGNGEGCGWVKMINQTPKGNFARYDKFLLKHFGLQAFFETTRRAVEDSMKWEEHANHRWHNVEEMKTTICYLTLPRAPTKQKSYQISETEANCGDALLRGVQSSIIQLPDLANREKRVKQFRRALRVLQLKPYIHPSQLQTTATTEPTKRCLTKADSAPGGGDENVQDLDKVEWPQLVILAQSESRW